MTDVQYRRLTGEAAPASRKRPPVKGGLPSSCDSPLEETFLGQLRQLRLPEPVRQHRATEGRKWAWDFAYPDLSPPLLIDLHGGVWTQGRHSRAAGMRNDFEKHNRAVMDGFQVLLFTSPMVTDGSAAFLVERLLKVMMTREGETE